MVQGSRGFSVLFAAPTTPIDLGIFHRRRKTKQRSRSRNAGSMDYHRCMGAEKPLEKRLGIDAESTDYRISARRISGGQHDSRHTIASHIIVQDVKKEHRNVRIAHYK